MTNRKSTKKALLTSVLCLMLCFSMLVGTTFAWFTDEVESGVNQIIAGNLDVEVYNSLTADESKKVGSTTELFDEITFWEPGVVAYENLTVANVGNLALKYQLSVIFDKATTNANGDTLAKVLKVGFVEGGIQSTTREGALSEVKAWLPLASFAQNGELYAEEGKDTHTYGIVIYWQPGENDNDYNMNNENKGIVLSIDLGIQLVATQLMAEEDSFGKDYDANAILPWDGSADTSWYDDSKTEYVLYTAEELAGLATLINGGNNLVGKTVKLGADIDLGGRSWTPINLWYPEKTNNLTIDGNGHKISNMTVLGNKSGVGFISQMTGNVTIQNLTFENASVVGSGNFIGTVVGYQYGNLVLNNVDVENSEVCTTAARGIRIGGLVGFSVNDSGTTISLADCDVRGTTIKGYHNLGGLVGTQQTTVYTYTNCSVKDCTIYAGTTTEKYADEIAVDGGTFATTYTATVENTKVIYGAIGSAADLLALGGKSLEGNYNLIADIDLNGEAMPTIGAAYGKTLTINGNNHTISNATTAHTNHNGMKHHGFFYAYTNSTLNISDLVFENIVIDATNDAERNYGAGIVVAFADGGSTVNLTNVDVKNCKVLNSTPDIGDEAGVYVGYQTGTLTMVDCDSTGCSVAGETVEKTGAFIGMVNGTATLTNCTTDLTIGACNRIAGSLVVDGATCVTSAEALKEALGSGNNVVLNGTIDLNNETVAIPDGTTISGGTIENATLTVADDYTASFVDVEFGDTTAVKASGDGELRFTNCEFNVNPDKNGFGRAGAIIGANQYYTIDLYLDGCTFNYQYETGDADLWNNAIFMWSNVKSCTIKNCTFNDYGFVAVKLMNVAEGAEIVFEGNTFNMSKQGAANYYNNNAIQIVPQHDNAFTAKFINNTFNGDYEDGKIVAWIDGMSNLTLTKHTIIHSGNTINGAAVTDDNFAINP